MVSLLRINPTSSCLGGSSKTSKLAKRIRIIGKASQNRKRRQRGLAKQRMSERHDEVLEVLCNICI